MFPGARSKVDYVAIVDNAARALCDAKSPSVMKKVGELLPMHGIKLKWVTGQTFIPKLLSKVCVLYSLLRLCLKDICAGCIVLGLETSGMDVSNLPQLLDRVPSREG